MRGSRRSNGPEVLDKYVGASEEKIRELFADAEAEQQSEGDRSMWKSTVCLHKSFLGDDAALMTESSRVRPTPPRHRRGVASMAWRFDCREKWSPEI